VSIEEPRTTIAGVRHFLRTNLLAGLLSLTTCSLLKATINRVDGFLLILPATGVDFGENQDKTAKRVLNVYVPNTPNPTSDHYLIVPEDEVVPLDMTVEDPFKLLISGGIINPESQQFRNNQLKPKGGNP
jgi:hypothetical protein